MDFNEVWKRPFELVGNYIFDKNGVMVFTFDYSIKKEVREQVTSLLNGENKYEPFDFHLERGSECIWFNDIPVGFFRGWGHLIGVGGLGLSKEEATEVQDAFIKDCMDKLTSARQ